MTFVNKSSLDFRNKQKQLACILGRQQIFFELEADESNEEDTNNKTEQMELMRNVQLNLHFLNLAREVPI